MIRDDFIEGMSHAACTVSVITTDGASGKIGVTVSAMSSVSADPPSLLVCVHHHSKACAALRNNGVMCVNVLRDDQSHISDRFAGMRPFEDAGNFSYEKWRTDSTGAPMLSDALVNFDCNISEIFQFGSHYIFIGEVQKIHTKESGKVLVYANRAYGHTHNHTRKLPSNEAGDNATKAVVKVGCFATLGPFFMPSLLSQFWAEHSDTNVMLDEGSQRILLEGLNNHNYDIILAYDIDIPEQFATHVLADVSPYVLLPATHPLAHAEDISLAELAEQPMVLLDMEPSKDYFTKLFKDRGLQPHIAFNASSFEMTRGMVGNGLGYSLLISKPAFNMSYDGSALVTKPLRDKVASAKIVLAYPKQLAKRQAVATFVQFTREFFAQKPA